MALLLLCTWWIQIHVAKQIWSQAKEDKFTYNHILPITHTCRVHVTQQSQIKWATPVAISLKIIEAFRYIFLTFNVIFFSFYFSIKVKKCIQATPRGGASSHGPKVLCILALFLYNFVKFSHIFCHFYEHIEKYPLILHTPNRNHTKIIHPLKLLILFYLRHV